MTLPPPTTVDAFAARIEAQLPIARLSDVIEREVKVLGVDPEAIERRLRELGAELVFAGNVTTVRLAASDLPLDCPLKYRTLQGYPPTIILKGPTIPHPRFKLRREVTWELRGDASPAQVARRIGGVVGDRESKERTSFTLEGHSAFHVDIDSFPEGDTYIEIEGASDSAIDDALQHLGLAGAHLSQLTGKQLRRGRVG